MTLLIEGINRVRDLIYDDIDKAQLGTSGTASAESDTDLGTPDWTTVDDITKTKADKAIKIDYTLLSTGGSTATYKEFKTYKSAGTVDYSRIVFTGISFTPNGSHDLTLSTIWYLRSV